MMGNSESVSEQTQGLLVAVNCRYSPAFNIAATGDPVWID
jgi:hypothetical protein